MTKYVIILKKIIVVAIETLKINEKHYEHVFAYCTFCKICSGSETP